MQGKRTNKNKERFIRHDYSDKQSQKLYCIPLLRMKPVLFTHNKVSQSMTSDKITVSKVVLHPITENEMSTVFLDW